MRVRKILLLCALVTILLCGAAGATDVEFSMSTPTVMENEIAVLIKCSGNGQNLNFCAAFYDEQEKYLESAIQQQRIYSFSKSVSIPLNNGIPVDADTVKIMALDDDFRPVCPAVSKSTKIPVFAYEITDIGFKHWTSRFSGEWYRAYVEITNTGTQNIYMKDCVFDFEDNNGHLLKSDNFISNCPDIIAPGEKGYFYQRTSSFKGVPLENGVRLMPTVTVIPTRDEPLDYEVSDVSLREGTFGPTVTGRVKNTSDKDDNLFYIEVIYYDSDGKVLDITGTTLLNFTAGSTMSFEISGMMLGEDVTMEAIADYRVMSRASYYQYSQPT